MKKEWIVGGVVVAGLVTATALIIKRVRRREEENAVEETPIRSEGTIPQSMRVEFPVNDQNKNELEFEKFRANLDINSRIEFDLYYEQLHAMLSKGGVTPEMNQVGLLFLSAIVHRNRIDQAVFNDFSKYILEGNAELLPEAIRRASTSLTEQQLDVALQSGQRAMDLIIGGFAREEFLSQVAN